ncbi:MAG: hypothetical protein HY340_01330, partial [Candidatus Kerfeldbacteria bacterium]|nr:hypothetical protein [Candidatus Kerfeldbacteria bacterium]
YVIADAASPNHVTLQGATWDPTLNIGGDFDFTGTGAANEIVTAPDAAATWTVSGNVNFTDGTYTKSAETLVMNGTSKTLTSASQTLNNLTLSGTITLANATHTIAGNLSMASGVITAGSSTITMSGTSNTITGGGATLNNLTIDPATAGTITAQTSDFTVSSALSVATGDTLSIASGITVTWTGSSFTLDGTISGSGRLTVNTATVIPTGGTLSSVVRFYMGGGTVTAPARTYGSDVEVYNNTSSILLLLGAGTHTIGGSVLVIADGIGGLTYDGSANNPTVNITGSIDFTGSGSGTEDIATGTGIWTVSGNVDFTDGTLTATAGNTFRMNGSGKTLTSASQSFRNFAVTGGSVSSTDAMDVNGTFQVTGGGFTQAANANINVLGNMTLSSGTTFTAASGSGRLVFDGDLTYTDNTSPVQTVSHMQVSTATVDLASDMAATGLTVDNLRLFNTNGYEVDIGTNGINIVGLMDFADDVELDETFVTDAGSLTVASTASLNIDQSTITMDGTSGTVDVITDGSHSLYNFIINDGGNALTVELEDSLDVNNNLTITGGTLDTKSGEDNAITVGGSWDNDDTFEARSGLVTFDAGSGTKTIDADGTGTDAFNHVVFNDSAGTAVFQLTTNMDVNGNFTITGGEVQPQTNTINLAGNWSNSDLFTHGSSTVVFDSGVGGQTITTSNTVSNMGAGSAITDETGKRFNNVQINSSGTVTLGSGTDNDLSVQGNLTFTAGILDIGDNDNHIVIKGNWDASAVTEAAFEARESTYSSIPQVQFYGTSAQTITIQSGQTLLVDSVTFGDIGLAETTYTLKSSGGTVGTFQFYDYFIILSGVVTTSDDTNADVTVDGAGGVEQLIVGDTAGEDSAAYKEFQANDSTVSVKEIQVTNGETAGDYAKFVAENATVTVTGLIRIGDTGETTESFNTFDASTTSSNTVSAETLYVQVGTVTLGDSRPWDIGRNGTSGYGIRIYANGTLDGATNTSDSVITTMGDFAIDTGGTFSAGSTTVTLDGAAATAQKIDPDGDITFNNLALDDTGNRTVTIADVDTSGRRVTVSGTFTWDGTVAANAVDVQIGSTTFTAILDLTNATAANSSVIVPSGRTLTMITTSSIELSGNWTNNGTFTRATSTVTAEGSNQQTFSGTLTGASQFYNLTITNSSGSDPESSPSLIFGAAATTENNFTATTANTKLRFNAGSTYTFQTISFNGQATGTRVVLRSSTQGTQWNLNVAGTRSVSNTDVRDSNACGQAPIIDATDGTNLDAGNNSCWDMNSITFSISDTTIGFGALSAATGRWATGDLNGSNASAGSTPTAAHTMTITTNARSGYAITYSGATLTSGGNTIDVASIDEDSDGTPGSEQYGLSVSTDGNATIASGYLRDTAADFTWVASTTTTIVSETSSTATETISASYLGNISTVTEAGSYSTTVTYIASGTF